MDHRLTERRARAVEGALELEHGDATALQNDGFRAAGVAWQFVL